MAEEQREFCFDAPAPGSLDKEAARRKRQLAQWRAAGQRYERTEKGQLRRKRANAQPAAKAARQMHERSDRGKILRQIRRMRARVKRCIAGQPRHVFPTVAAWKRFQYATDKHYAIACRLRARIRQVLSRRKMRKDNKTQELLGCSINDFTEHLEKHFLPGMTWENRSLWDIDHQTPCWAYDLRRMDEQKRCFSFENLRPMWRTDNRRKKNKLASPRQLPLV